MKGVWASGLSTTRVAGQQRRDGVADAERERVVPGRDDADHAARAVALGRAGEERQGALAAARRQVILGAVGVVARLDGDVLDLFEGVVPRLARLELDDVEDLGGVAR